MSFCFTRGTTVYVTGPVLQEAGGVSVGTMLCGMLDELLLHTWYYCVCYWACVAGSRRSISGYNVMWYVR